MNYSKFWSLTMEGYVKQHEYERFVLFKGSSTNTTEDWLEIKYTKSDQGVKYTLLKLSFYNPCNLFLAKDAIDQWVMSATGKKLLKLTLTYTRSEGLLKLFYPDVYTIKSIDGNAFCNYAVQEMIHTSWNNKFFITIPKYNCNLNLIIEETRQYFKLLDRKLQGQLWCKELHKDNTLHLHGLLLYEDDLFIDIDEYGSILKLIEDKNTSHSTRVHPHVEIPKNSKAVKEYIKKTMQNEPGNIQASGTLLAELQSSNGNFLTDAMDSIIKGEKTFSDIMRESPNYNVKNKMALFKNARNLEYIEKFASSPLRKLKFIMPIKPKNVAHRAIYTWLKNLNSGKLKDDSCNMKNLFISGPTQTGKSSFVKYLQSCFKTYSLDNSAWFNADWKDKYFDLCIYDEFTPSTEKKFPDLNLFIRGTKDDRFQVKNGQIKKTTNIPCLFLTNYNTDEILEKNRQTAYPFLKRFKFVHITTDNPLPLDFRDYVVFKQNNQSTQTELDFNIDLTFEGMVIELVGNTAHCKFGNSSNGINLENLEWNIKIRNQCDEYLNSKGTGAIILNSPEVINFTCDTITFSELTDWYDPWKGIYFQKLLTRYALNKYKATEKTHVLDVTSLLNIVYYPINDLEIDCICADTKDDPIILACGHKYHLECWESWTMENGVSCVYCRREFHTDITYFPIISCMEDIQFVIPNENSMIRRTNNCILDTSKISGIGICSCSGCLND